MGILNAVMCALIKVWNLIQDHLIETLVNLIAGALDLLPSIPIESEELVWGEFGRAIGYFLPISTMLQHFTLFLGLMLVWYSYEYIMRLIKMIK